MWILISNSSQKTKNKKQKTMNSFHTLICFIMSVNTLPLLNGFVFHHRIQPYTSIAFQRNPQRKSISISTSKRNSISKSKRNSKSMNENENLDTPSISEQIQLLKQNGIIHLPSVVSTEMVDIFQNYIQDQKILAWFAGFQVMEAEAEADAEEQRNSSSVNNTTTTTTTIINRSFYGKKQSDLSCDLQLSLLRSGYVADLDKNTSSMERHVLADMLVDIFDGNDNDDDSNNNNGTTTILKDLCNELGLEDAYMKELGVFMSDPGYLDDADTDTDTDTDTMEVRCTDWSCDDNDDMEAPLYEIAVALNDVTEFMGSTTYFLTSHTSSHRDLILSGKDNDDNLSTYTPMLQKGDVIVYDARMVKLDHPNDSTQGSLNAKLQLSFHNPKVNWNSIKYNGTIRPGYVDAILFSDLMTTIAAYSDGDGDAFSKYGDGITKAFHDVESSLDTELILESKSESEIESS